MPARDAQVRVVDTQYDSRRLLVRLGSVYDHVIRINSANRAARTDDNMQTICIWEVQTTLANEPTCRRLSGQIDHNAIRRRDRLVSARVRR